VFRAACYPRPFRASSHLTGALAPSGFRSLFELTLESSSRAAAVCACCSCGVPCRSSSRVSCLVLSPSVVRRDARELQSALAMRVGAEPPPPARRGERGAERSRGNSTEGSTHTDRCYSRPADRAASARRRFDCRSCVHVRESPRISSCGVSARLVIRRSDAGRWRDTASRVRTGGCSCKFRSLQRRCSDHGLLFLVRAADRSAAALTAAADRRVACARGDRGDRARDGRRVSRGPVRRRVRAR
jgi:hypothetical protein